MERKTGNRRAAAFLAGAAMALLLAVLAGLAVCSLFVTVHEGYDQDPMNELVVFWQDNPALSLAATAVMIAGLGALAALLRAGERIRLMRLLALLLLAGTLGFLWSVQMVPRADQERVVEAALCFARGDYSPMRDVYFTDYSFQLGLCLLLEGLARLMPGVSLALLMQLLNAGMSLAAAAVALRLLALLEGDGRARHAAGALYLLFAPMPLYCVYAYGTIPMLLLTLCALLCFARYTREDSARCGLACAVCIALAVVMKPNAMVPLIALCIAAALHALNRRDIRPLLYAALAVGLSLLLPRLVIWQYELRSGERLTGDLSMLARLVMGFQRSEVGAGWFNNYTERFSTRLMPRDEARAILLADARALAAQYAAEPGSLLQFLKEKCFSMWLEPAYSTLWVGAISDFAGRFNGLAHLLYRETSPLRMALERGMDVYQQAMYALACVGMVRTFRRRADPAQLLLPLCVLGGFLYHMLFEAKSQYIYVYAFMLLPLAAQGLAAVMRCAGRLARRMGGGGRTELPEGTARRQENA